MGLLLRFDPSLPSFSSPPCPGPWGAWSAASSPLPGVPDRGDSAGVRDPASERLRPGAGDEEPDRGDSILRCCTEARRAFRLRVVAVPDAVEAWESTSLPTRARDSSPPYLPRDLPRAWLTLDPALS